ncbi:MAG: lasso peptide biosynthesis protein [Gammaproteobacteria bacterium]
MKQWVQAARNLPATSPAEYKLVKTYASVLSLVHRANWQGACHATSAVLTVLLRDQQIQAEPFLGECFHNGAFFDHSWVEVNSKIYDIAISNPLISEQRCEPVFRSYHITTKQPTQIKYGVTSGCGLEPTAAMIEAMPFSQYLSNFPQHPKGLWGITEEVAKKELGLRTNAAKLEAAHSSIIWQKRVQSTLQADGPAFGGPVA